MQIQTESIENEVETIADVSTFSFESVASTSSQSHSENVDCHEFDIGNWMGKSALMTSTQKREMLTHCWKPPESYNFREEAKDAARPFILKWLQLYSPWLAYTRKGKGALCLYCVLFPPTTVRGILGAFIAAPFNKYKNIHESAKNHSSSQWHKNSITAAKSFMDSLPVDVQMVSGCEKQIEQNRKILSSIISTIMFCGTHDIALRGKNANSGKRKC